MVVSRQEALRPGIYRLTLRVPFPFKAQPGQFFHVRCGDTAYPLLRRPLSLCDYDERTGELTLLYRVEGVGTDWLSRRLAGDRVDVMGPLGRGFPLPSSPATCTLIGGGIGVPPLYYLAKQLSAQGHALKVVLGFASERVSFLVDEFRQFGEVFVATEDGSAGQKGRVTDLLARLPGVEREKEQRDFSARPEVYYACGPMPMLRAVKAFYGSFRASGPRETTGDGATGPVGYLSLEERMGCGVGACLACVVPATRRQDGKDYRKICSDGPVFDAREIRI
ncbi:MAG: hypothetical protein BAA01_13060 [Bacillus thermozeamaize]|jgi:dihydroorotate dehydrogenase electron transfer subunit|uniref:Dihydroorotate dehydrogenase B (NAD(+)), electron transfer subunit n=1 Tax=Bacillus thermozeamaize TaxID=230954 RepID=A0A1Y3PK63_9BACI|nr:MAG: hypothetical protein BAA01_13060 [Bacillus thermozeamaize]